jgi:hypothetical protein
MTDCPRRRQLSARVARRTRRCPPCLSVWAIFALHAAWLLPRLIRCARRTLRGQRRPAAAPRAMHGCCAGLLPLAAPPPLRRCQITPQRRRGCAAGARIVAAAAAGGLSRGAPGGAGGAAVGEYVCPTLLNNCPHPREVRQHFYGELSASVRARGAALPQALRFRVATTLLRRWLTPRPRARAAAPPDCRGAARRPHAHPHLPRVRARPPRPERCRCLAPYPRGVPLR